MEQYVPILDHGYIKLVETWGSDEAIIEAARMSTNKGFQGWDSDAKLLAYLHKHKHSTPFEMAGAVIEVKAPIFVFREWHRHRTQSYNEMSARYVPLPDESYLPSAARLTEGATAAQATSNRQANSEAQFDDEYFDGEWALNVQCKIDSVYTHQQEAYEALLAEGVPKELARVVLSVGRYSKMRAQANLRNWLGFLTLRQDVKAQYEIRVYADVLNSMLEDRFPRTLGLFNEEV